MAAADPTTSASEGDLQAVEVRLPESLMQAVEGFLASRPQLDASRLLQNALAQFLVQQGGARPEVRELYLDGLFGSGL
jgi:metal-responsive CopG/Arc/MetJ family transcriptional regulator